MKRVYYDVENTLDLPFITGIQRVVREFSKVALRKGDFTLKHQYIPIVYDYKRSSWRKLHDFEKKSLLSNTPRSMKFLNRVMRKLRRRLPREHLLIDQIEADSIFLDIESSWHSKLDRKNLLPAIVKSNIISVKLHYDIIPILFPDSSHPNTVNVFADHFASHLEHSNLFICISNTTKNDVVNYCLTNAKPQPQLETIQLGSNLAGTKVTKSDSSPSAVKYGKYILSVGTVEPRKNFPLLLNAFTKVADRCDLTLVIVGKTGWLSEKIISEIHNHESYGDRVHHLDNVSDALLDELYQNAWLNVVPSMYEGFGLPVVESLARNCPTLCSDAGSLSEFNNEEVMFFRSGSSRDLADSILKLSSDHASYSKLATGAQKFTPITWQETTLQIDQCLSAFAKSRRNS